MTAANRAERDGSLLRAATAALTIAARPAFLEQPEGWLAQARRRP